MKKKIVLQIPQRILHNNQHDCDFIARTLRAAGMQIDVDRMTGEIVPKHGRMFLTAVGDINWYRWEFNSAPAQPALVRP